MRPGATPTPCRKVFSSLLIAMAGFLASCASSEPPVGGSPIPAQIQEPASGTGPCTRYVGTADYGRCELYASSVGWRFTPRIGRSADLDTQLRCAFARAEPDRYAECITSARRGADPAALARYGPSAPSTGHAVAPTAARETRFLVPVPVRPEPVLVRSAPRVVRDLEEAKAPAVPVHEPSVDPWCGENGSCYGDISSYTGRPRTVHVSGYYRKDGTYVRSHYRSRPRW